jgi:hypothetical protein
MLNKYASVSLNQIMRSKTGMANVILDSHFKKCSKRMDKSISINMPALF